MPASIFASRIKSPCGWLFFSASLLGWLLSAALLQLLVGHYGLGKVISKLTTILVVLLLQYNLNRLFSFRKAR